MSCDLLLATKQPSADDAIVGEAFALEISASAPKLRTSVGPNSRRTHDFGVRNKVVCLQIVHNFGCLPAQLTFNY